MLRSIASYLLSISNWLLLFCGVIILSYLFFANLKNEPALIINQLEIVKTTLEPNEPLQLKFHVTLNKSNCDMYAERTISNSDTSETVWQSISPINAHVIEKEIVSKIPFVVQIPQIKPGNYFYFAKIHVICGKSVDIIPTKLIPFKVISNVNASK